MGTLSVYYRPIITHLSDDDGRTLCGIAIRDDWECGSQVWDEEMGAICGCVRCQRIVDKRAATPTAACKEDGRG